MSQWLQSRNEVRRKSLLSKRFVIIVKINNVDVKWYPSTHLKQFFVLLDMMVLSLLVCFIMKKESFFKTFDSLLKCNQGNIIKTYSINKGLDH